jgi:hypothetical protein
LVSDENIGKVVQEGLKEYEDNFKLTENKVYTEFGDKYGTIAAQAPDTEAILKRIIDQQGKDYFKGIDPRFTKMFEKIAGVFKGRKPTVDGVRVRALKQEGLGPSAIAKTLGIGRASVYRALGEQAGDV